MAKIRAKRTSPSFSEAFLLSICKKSTRLHFFFFWPLFLSFWEHWHLTGLIATYGSLSTKIFLPSHWRFLLWVNYFMFFRVGNPLVILKLPKNDIFNFPHNLQNTLPLTVCQFFFNSLFCSSDCIFRFSTSTNKSSLSKIPIVKNAKNRKNEGKFNKVYFWRFSVFLTMIP